MSTSVIFVIVAAIAIFVLIYRSANGENVYKYVSDKTAFIYDKFAPYSFKTIREKVKDLGQEYSTHQYMVQIVSYSTDNTKRGRTCGSGKKYKQCCGK